MPNIFRSDFYKKRAGGRLFCFSTFVLLPAECFSTHYYPLRETSWSSQVKYWWNETSDIGLTQVCFILLHVFNNNVMHHTKWGKPPNILTFELTLSLCTALWTRNYSKDICLQTCFCYLNVKKVKRILCFVSQ